MYNPTYLVRSRHAIYYFRYPLPQCDNRRISISLNTRCPKEALRLSKALEYHACMVISHPDVQELDYAEVKEMLRNHFSEVLERMKRSIDKDGALSVERVFGISALLMKKKQSDLRRKQRNVWFQYILLCKSLAFLIM